MEQRFVSPQERLTPAEAEEVLKRFREEEELRQREMEAQATNPTVADMAEGLGVPPERVAALLNQVRGGAVPPAPFQAQEVAAVDAQTVVRRANRMAWVIAAIVMLFAFIALAITATFVFSSTSEQAPATAPQPDVPAPDGASGGPTTPSAEAPSAM